MIEAQSKRKREEMKGVKIVSDSRHLPLRKLILESGLGGITWHYYSLNPIRDIAHLIFSFSFSSFFFYWNTRPPKSTPQPGFYVGHGDEIIISSERCRNHIHQKKTPDLGDHHDIMYELVLNLS